MLMFMGQQGMSGDLLDLMSQVLAKDPKNRPEFNEIIKHAWFSGREELEFSTEPDIE